MKKRSVYIITLALFIIAVFFVFFKYKTDEKKKEAAVYELLQRKGVSVQNPEWEATRKNAFSLLNKIDINPADTKSMIALATLYIREARVTGNYAYYDRAAMKYVNDVLKNEPNNFEALTLKALLYMSQHHFADGLAIAQQAKNSNPYNAFVYGMLVDGNVEMGNYDSAVVNSDKMGSIRPDLRSYSRVSYLREIYGDYPGAIDAMKMAVEAGAPGDETTEWARIQLAHLYENTGALKYAEMHYTIALNERPGYAYAYAGLAHIALAAKDYAKAIALYQQADSLVNDFSFKEELVEVYNSTGQKDKAAAISKIAIDEMNKNAHAGNSDENIGHYADRELAYAYLRIDNFDKALEHAIAEYNRRPNNIDVNETVAWVYYKKGDYAKALPYIQVALKTGSKNPTLLCRAGLIFLKAGDKVKAKEYLQEALKSNPNIFESLKNESMNALKEL